MFPQAGRGRFCLRRKITGDRELSFPSGRSLRFPRRVASVADRGVVVYLRKGGFWNRGFSGKLLLLKLFCSRSINLVAGKSLVEEKEASLRLGLEGGSGRVSPRACRGKIVF